MVQTKYRFHEVELIYDYISVLISNKDDHHLFLEVLKTKSAVCVFKVV